MMCVSPPHKVQATAPENLSQKVAESGVSKKGAAETLPEAMPIEGVLYAVRAVRVLGLFHRPTHLFHRAVHVFPCSTLCDHCTRCIVSLLQYQACPFHGFLARMAVTYARSNGDRVPATVISPPKCGQYMSIEYDTMCLTPSRLPTKSHPSKSH